MNERGSKLAVSTAVRVVLLAVLSSASVVPAGCIAGRGGAAVFPTRYDVGPATTSSGGRADTGVHYAAGLSWASFNPSPTGSWDVVVGYEVEDFGEPERTSSAGPVPTAAPPDPERRRLVHGLFFEVARRILGDTRQRVWLGVKGEVLFDRGDTRERATLGASTRLGWELFRGVKRATPSAGIEGAFAIGVFAEAGLRKGPGDESFVALGGLTIRLPAAAVR